MYSTYLFPIKTTLSNGQIHWYLIVLYRNLSENVFVVWDSLWKSCTKREKEWDKTAIRYVTEKRGIAHMVEGGGRYAFR